MHRFNSISRWMGRRGRTRGEKEKAKKNDKGGRRRTRRQSKRDERRRGRIRDVERNKHRAWETDQVGRNIVHRDLDDALDVGCVGELDLASLSRIENEKLLRKARHESKRRRGVLFSRKHVRTTVFLRNFWPIIRLYVGHGFRMMKQSTRYWQLKLELTTRRVSSTAVFC